MAKKKISRSPWYGSDEIDAYISEQKKPRFVMYKTGERQNMYSNLDAIREYARKHKASLQPQYTFDAEGHLVPVNSHADEATEPVVQRNSKTRVFKAKVQTSNNMVTVIVNGTEIRVPAGSKVEIQQANEKEINPPCAGFLLA